MYVEIGKGIDPFQFFATFNGKFIGVFHEFTVTEVDMQDLKEILAFGEDVDFFVVVGDSLVEDVTLCAVVHALHDLLLTV
jgi:hypothetical protein